MLLVAGSLVGTSPAWGSGSGGPLQMSPTALLTAIESDGGKPTLDWSLQGSSDEINVLPNLRCELGPEGSWPQFPASDPCLWLVDHKAPLPGITPPGCLASREPGVGGPAPYASWRCDARAFRDVVIHAAQSTGDRSYVMFNTTANGGSGVCSTIPITVLLGNGYGELQADDGCPQTIRCNGAYAGTVRSDATDTVTGCGTGSGGSGSGGSGPGGSGGAGTGSGGSGSGGSGSGGSGSPGAGGTASTLPPAPGSGSSTKKQSSRTSRRTGSSCPGASSGTKGASPLYSVLVKPRGKRGMKIYVHMRRAVPITVDVRMRRGRGRTPKIVRWVSRCAKKGTNLITLRNATGGAKNRRNYKVYVKSPNSSYPLRSSWEALPRR